MISSGWRFIAAIVCVGLGVIHAQPRDLTVFWVVNGTLYRWQAGDVVVLADNNALTPYPAPNGEAVAYTAGRGRLPQSLWIVETDGAPRELVAVDDLDGLLLAQVAWNNSEGLFFNTTRLSAPFGSEPQNDLHYVDRATRTITTWLAEGDGGLFALSPDGTYVAVAYPGEFTPQGAVARGGTIAIYNAAPPMLPAASLAFSPVETGTHGAFYPSLDWNADSRMLNTAIPAFESDILTLWEIAPTGTVQQAGTLPLGLEGAPRWSTDGSYIAYINNGESAGNLRARSLTIAERDGTTVATIGESIGSFSWSQSGTALLYGLDMGLTIYTQSVDESHTLPITPLNAILLDDNTLVYADANGQRVTIHIADLVDNTTIAIDHVDNPQTALYLAAVR